MPYKIKALSRITKLYFVLQKPIHAQPHNNYCIKGIGILESLSLPICLWSKLYLLMNISRINPVLVTNSGVTVGTARNCSQDFWGSISHILALFRHDEAFKRHAFCEKVKFPRYADKAFATPQTLLQLYNINWTFVPQELESLPTPYTRGWLLRSC